MPPRHGFDPYALPPLRRSERRRLFWLGLSLGAGYLLVLAVWVYAVAG
jgi:hypothetical protein